MNTTVTANNMQVRAVAEKGLLINEVEDADSTTWDELATAKQAGTDTPLAALSLLYPASTADGTNWYHNASKKSNDAAKATAANTKSGNLIGNYEQLTSLTAISAMSVGTATAGSQAAFSTMGRTDDAEAGYYVHYTYYLKGAAGEAVNLGVTANAMNVKILSVTAEADDDDSEDLNSSLRVGIRMVDSGEFFIYAPITTTTTSYFVNAGLTTGENPTATGVPVSVKGSTDISITDLDVLPAIGDEGTPVEVYIWYEGEDAACKSDNALAAELDNIVVTINFKFEAVTADEATAWANAHS